MSATLPAPTRARKVLEAYLARPDALENLCAIAQRLLEALELDPRKYAPFILGAQNPLGGATFEARVELAHPRRRAREVSWGDVGPSTTRFEDLDPATRPTIPLTVATQTKVGDRDWTPSSSYPYHKLAYPTLNPIQSLALGWVERDVNVVVSAPTSAGKTLLAELFMGEALARGGKAIFLSPLRAVSQEKRDEWTSEAHPWSKLRVEILTGDYVLTAAKKRSLADANVIVMTSEMLDSKTRRIEVEGNDWLLSVAVVVVDELHLLTMRERGDALECGLMRFALKNPRARLVGLSATMPNVDELGRWIGALNGRPTVVLQTEWRPTKLTIHWRGYREGGSYQHNEAAKREAVLDLIEEFPRDKFLVFVHAKKAGWALSAEVRKRGIASAFHNADLKRDDRLHVERLFRSGELDELRVLIATSTLAYGMNLPARRVVVLGVHRGMEEVDPIDVRQECGRAGRYGIDPEGDAYVLVPTRTDRPERARDVRARFEKIGPIESQLVDEDVLAFHLTAEVAEGGVESEAAAVAWHDRSFAAFRGRRLAEYSTVREDSDGEARRSLSAGSILERLAKVGILKLEETGGEICAVPLATCPGCKGDGYGANASVECERCGGDGFSLTECPRCHRFRFALDACETHVPADGLCGGVLDSTPKGLLCRECHSGGPPTTTRKRYVATELGRVSSWLYFSPFDVADWASNFRRIVERGQQEDDVALAWALGTIKTAFKQYIPRELDALARQVQTELRARGHVGFLRVTVATLAWYSLILGREVKEIAAAQAGIRADIPRIFGALEMIDERVLRLLGKDFLELVQNRATYGVSWEEAELCRLPGIGGARAGKLFRAGVRTVPDVWNMRRRVVDVLGLPTAAPAIRAARDALGITPGR